jgi:hypothetical protein
MVGKEARGDPPNSVDAALLRRDVALASSHPERRPLVAAGGLDLKQAGFSEMLAYTIAWLSAQNYTLASGAHPAERVTLTDKGLAALNRMPQGLTGTVGRRGYRRLPEEYNFIEKVAYRPHPQ